MHNGLTHRSQVVTNWELIGLGMFGEGAQHRNTAGLQDNQSLHTAVSVSCETVTLTRLPPHKYHLAVG